MTNDFMLYQNYPNTFNLSTVLKIFLSSRENVINWIYDIEGQIIETVMNWKTEADFHEFYWAIIGVSVE